MALVLCLILFVCRYSKAVPSQSLFIFLCDIIQIKFKQMENTGINSLSGVATQLKLPSIMLVSYEHLRTSFLHVDKLKLIEEIQALIPRRSVFILRPSKWGKTTTIDMLENFYAFDKVQTNEQSVEKRAWLQQKKTKLQLPPNSTICSHFSRLTKDLSKKFIVFRIDLKRNNPCREMLADVMKEMCKKKYSISDQIKRVQNVILQEVNQNRLKSMAGMMTLLIDNLSYLIKRKIVILIDNYDSIVFSEDFRAKSREQRRAQLELLERFLRSCEASSSNVIHRTIIFGVYSIFPNNLGFLSSSLYDGSPFLKTALGFTKSEVRQMIDNYFASSSQKKKQDILQNLDKKYSGYIVKADDEEIELFNNFHVIQYLKMVEALSKQPNQPQERLTSQIVARERDSVSKLGSILLNNSPTSFERAQILINLLRKKKYLAPSKYNKFNMMYSKSNFRCFQEQNFIHTLLHIGYLRIKDGSLQIPNLIIEKILVSVLTSWIKEYLVDRFKEFIEQKPKLQLWTSFEKALMPIIEKTLHNFRQYHQQMLIQLSFFVIKCYFQVTTLAQYNILAQQSSPSLLCFSQKVRRIKDIIIVHNYQVSKMNDSQQGIKNFIKYQLQEGIRRLFYKKDMRTLIYSIKDKPIWANSDLIKVRFILVICSFDNTRHSYQEITLPTTTMMKVLNDFERRLQMTKTAYYDDFYSQWLQQSNQPSFIAYLEALSKHSISPDDPKIQ